GNSIANSSIPDFIALKANSPNNVLLLAGDGRIFSTKDAGMHWVSTGPGISLGLTAGVVTEGQGAWGIDGSAFVFRQANRGASWSKVANQVDTSLKLQSIAANGKQSAWAVGANSQGTSLVIHTTDGTTWQQDGTLPQLASTTLSSISVETQGRCGRA